MMRSREENAAGDIRSAPSALRILFVSLHPRPLGGAKPFFQIAPEFAQLGWQTDFVSLAEVVPGDESRMRRARAEYLRSLVHSQAAGYDIIDFDHGYLPFPRSEFPSDTLLVARSVLLRHQVDRLVFPQPWSARRLAGVLVKGHARRSDRAEAMSFAVRSVQEADLVNVCNDDDAALLIRSGLDPERVVVFPYGLSAERHAQFASMDAVRPYDTVVAFVGTFDWRKGAADMPQIVGRVVQAVPEARFRLLGTKGMFPKERDVLRHFPVVLHPHLDVVPVFESAELPHLLKNCALAYFPSYLEGFGFAVLEMLAASLPVVAYDAPGPRMMLEEAFLVSPGDTDEFAARIVSLLRDPAGLQHARVAARRRASDFQWKEIAEQTAAVYAERLERIRNNPSAGRSP